MCLAFPDLAEIVSALQMSIVLEVNGYPKPGNVTRHGPFEEIAYEDFLCAASSLRTPLVSGFAAARQDFVKGHRPSGIWGRMLLGSAEKAMRGRSNTIFGVLLLEIPLGIGAAIAEETDHVLEKARQVVADSTPEDSVCFVRATRKSGVGGLEHGGLDTEARRYDLNHPDIEARLRADSITLEDLLSLSAGYDILARELTQGFPVTELYSRRYLEWVAELKDPRRACSAVFCSMLSTYADTLIGRRAGREVAESVRSEAERIMELELFSDSWLSRMLGLDEYLRERDLNPGSLADLTAASIFIALLRGAS